MPTGSSQPRDTSQPASRGRRRAPEGAAAACANALAPDGTPDVIPASTTRGPQPAAAAGEEAHTDKGTGPGGARELDASSWPALLDAVASSRLRLSLTTSSGAHAVLVSADELSALDGRAAAAQAHQVVLTPRERQMLQHVAAGASTTEIAKALGVSVSTVSQHLATARRKYGVHSSTQAAALAHDA